MKSFKTPYGHEEYYLTIDQKPITKYLDEYVASGECDKLKGFSSMLGLYPAWGKELFPTGDRQFVWELIVSDEPTNLPVLICPDDMDLDCIVIVVAVRKDEQNVYWDRIGLLNHANVDYETEKRSGILCLERYSDDDWKKYGDNIAIAEVDSYEWRQWISKNWNEELIKRRRNYTYPYMQNNENIIWIRNLNFVFYRNEYNNCIEFFKQRLEA